jgi:O-antigen ligase
MAVMDWDAPRRTLWSDLARIALPTSIIFAGLLLHGSNSAFGAATLAVFLTLALVVSILATPGRVLRAVLSENAVSIVGVCAFCGWAAYTALAAGGPLTHPTWRAFDVAPGFPALSPFRVWEGLASFLGVVAAFGLGALAVGDRGARDQAALYVGLGGVGFGIFAIVQHVGAEAADRLKAGLGSANAAADVFAILAILAATLLIRAVRGRIGHRRTSGIAALAEQPIAVAGLAISLAALMLTASRAGILAALAAFALLGALLWRGMRRESGGHGGLAIVLGLAGVLVFAGADFALNRLDRLDADAPLRQAMLDTHWAAFLERPVWGHGLNAFHDLNHHLATAETFRALSGTGSVHNIYVQLLEEAGLVGAGCMALMLAPVLWRLLRLSLDEGRGWDWAAAGLSIALLLGLHGVVDFGLQTPAIAALAAFLIGAFARRRAASERENADETPEPAPVSRTAGLLASVGAAAGAFVVLDAADATQMALEAASVAQVHQDPGARAVVLANARAALAARPTRPETWHAGAAAAGAWLELGIAASSPPGEAQKRALAASAALAERALRGAPLQPRAWLHLAVVNQSGAPTDLCAGRTCVERSFAATPVASQELACARLAVAHRFGMLAGKDDPRVVQAALLYSNRRATARCLAFLPSKDVLSLMLLREVERPRQTRAS